jgi:hypothetical protein
MLVAGRWSLVAGRWSLVAGRWSLVAGRWSLVAGRWSLVSQRFSRAFSPLLIVQRETQGVALGYLQVAPMALSNKCIQAVRHITGVLWCRRVREISYTYVIHIPSEQHDHLAWIHHLGSCRGNAFGFRWMCVTLSM